MTKPERIIAATIVAIGLIITVLTTSGAVSWSGQQITLVSVESGAAGALVLAIYFHVKPGTKKEPVAVGASITGLTLATLYLLDGFNVTHFGNATIVAVGSATTGVLLVITTAFSRANVTAPTAPSIE